MSVVTLVVTGTPRPKGNLSAFKRASADGTWSAQVAEKSKGLGAWRRAIELAAYEQLRGERFDGPVRLSVTFALPRPTSVTRPAPTVKPDLDKLLRAVGDALTGILWTDDAQLVELVGRKLYAPADRPPHAVITVTHATRQSDDLYALALHDLLAELRP